MKRLYKSIHKVSKGNNFMILFTSSSNIIGNALTIISGLFVIKWLLPDELGYFNSFTIITGYIVLAHIGIPVGLNRNLPYLMGKDDKAEALKTASLAKFWSFTISSVISFLGILLLIYFIFYEKYQIAAGIFVIVAQTWQGIYVGKYLKILYRTNKDFNKLSIITLIVSTISFLSVYLIFLYGFYGLCLRAIIIVIFDYFFSWYWRPIKVPMVWDRLTFKNLLKVGFPIFIVNNIYGKWPLVQRTLILLALGTKSLGLFTVVFLIGNAYSIFSSSISSVLYPTMMIEWGKGKSIKELVKRNLVKPLLVIGTILLVITPILWFLIPPMINKFLSNYTEIINTAQWMVIAGFIGVFNLLGIFYNIINKQQKRLYMYLTGVTGWMVILIVTYWYKGITLNIFPKALIVGYFIMIFLSILFIKENWDKTQKSFE